MAPMPREGMGAKAIREYGAGRLGRVQMFTGRPS